MSIDLGLGPAPGPENHPEVDAMYDKVLAACKAQDRVICGCGDGAVRLQQRIDEGRRAGSSFFRSADSVGTSARFGGADSRYTQSRGEGVRPPPRLDFTHSRPPRYFASGCGRTWNFTAFCSVPGPPSRCHAA